MLAEKQLYLFIRNQYAGSILNQAHLQKAQKNYRAFHINVDLLDTIKNHSRIASLVIGNYPYFIQTLEKTIQEILTEVNLTLPLYGSKISVYFENCTIPRHNLKSIEFLTASLNQPYGTLVYIKDAEIIQIKDSELYRQSWTQIWEYACDCKFSVNTANLRLLKRKVTQSLLDIITKGCTTNIKDYCKGLEQISCPDCSMNLRFLTRDEFIYEQCNQIEVMFEAKTNILDNHIQFFNTGNFKILVDKHNTGKYKKGDILNGCCFFKSSVELSRPSAFTPKVQADITNLIYLVCSYPQQYYLTSANNLFFGNLRSVSLDQRVVTKLGSVNDIVYNYKNLIEAVNQVRFPYLGPNTLTALKLVTLASIFTLQANHEKLHLLIITDEVSMIVKSLRINDLSIKKLPIIYDEKTISNFINTCHNSIVLISNPDKRQFTLINKILRQQAYSNINFVFWIVCEPEDQLKKKFEINLIQMILDLSLKKNLNVCEDVYRSIIDDYLNCFMKSQEEENELIATIVKKFNRYIPYEYQKEEMGPFSLHTKNEKLKEEKLANDLLKRYFLKSREYKTTKLAAIQTLNMIAQSFTQFRYFIENNCFHKGDGKNEAELHLSILDVILAIFIDQQTSRNKYSSSNTLFADEVSKIMLNENTCNVSVWDYEVDNDFVQETKKYIPRDELMGIVISKIFNLVYGDE